MRSTLGWDVQANLIDDSPVVLFFVFFDSLHGRHKVDTYVNQPPFLYERMFCFWRDLIDSFTSKLIVIFENLYWYSMAPMVQWASYLPWKQVATGSVTFASKAIKHTRLESGGMGSTPALGDDFLSLMLHPSAMGPPSDCVVAHLLFLGESTFPQCWHFCLCDLCGDNNNHDASCQCGNWVGYSTREDSPKVYNDTLHQEHFCGSQCHLTDRLLWENDSDTSGCH